MTIDEVDNTIDLKFEIKLEWRDDRLTYNNLKNQDAQYLNLLKEEDVQKIWLPLVVYENTAQLETTRLGWITEWSTSVMVIREGNLSRYIIQTIQCLAKCILLGMDSRRWMRENSSWAPKTGFG